MGSEYMWRRANICGEERSYVRYERMERKYGRDEDWGEYVGRKRMGGRWIVWGEVYVVCIYVVRKEDK
jgi:hypothetical protein